MDEAARIAEAEIEKAVQQAITKRQEQQEQHSPKTGFDVELAENSGGLTTTFHSQKQERPRNPKSSKPFECRRLSCAGWCFNVFATAFLTRTQHKSSGFFWP